MPACQPLQEVLDSDVHYHPTMSRATGFFALGTSRCQRYGRERPVSLKSCKYANLRPGRGRNCGKGGLVIGQTTGAAAQQDAKMVLE